MQQQELALKGQEVQRKAQKDATDAQLKQSQQQIERERIATQKEIDMARIQASVQKDQQELAQRREWDYQQAELLEQVGLDAFLQSWLDQPLFVGLPEGARFETERKTNTVEGLAASLRSAGTSSMSPLWDRLHLIQCPVLVLTGERDTRYCEVAERLVTGIGSGATHEIIAGAGHAAHLEQPEATAAAVLKFQDQTEAPIQSPTDNNNA